MTQPQINHFEAVRGPLNAPGTGPNDSIVQTTVDGLPVYAFTVRDGDVQAWDTGNIGPSGKANQRAELSFAPAPGNQKIASPYNVREGMKQTYDIAYRFKAGYPTNQRWAVLTQFHPQDDNPSGFHGFGGVTVHGNEITFDNPNGDGGYFGRIPIKVDTWYVLRFAVNWSSKADGYVKVTDRKTGKPIAQVNGPTIAANEFKYVKQGYYRDGGITQEGTVYETLIDISDGDLTATAPTPTPTPAPAMKNNAPLRPAPAPSVQPNDGADALMSVRDDLVKLGDSRVQPQIDAINKLLGNGAWTP